MYQDLLLRLESPKVYALIQRSFTASEVAVLLKSYNFVVEHGANLEAETIRAEGVSFNPKMARILNILIHEGGVTSTAPLMLAMAGSIATSALSTFSAESGVQISEAALSAIQELTPAPSAEVELVRLSYWLDRVRHLHMSTLDRTAICDIHSQVINQLIPGIKFPQSEKLKTLLLAWSNRFKIGELVQ